MSRDAYSVVVPAYNATRTLEACLRHVFAATPAPAEVIVYDDGSTDGTGELARRMGARVIRNDGPNVGPAVGRNEGARAARHGIVVFVDADVAVEPCAPGRLARSVARAKSVVAAFGSYGSRAEVSNLAGRYANLRHHHTHMVAAGPSGVGEAETFWSGLGAVEREAFLRVGGFDTSYTRPCIEDVELGLRLREDGGRILVLPAAKGEHMKDWTLGQLWHTDMFCRALPWSELIVDGRIGDTLNTTSGEQTKSVIAHGVWLTAIGALFLPPLWGVVLGLALAYLWMNRDLLSVLWQRSKRLAAAGAGLHWFYHLYASAAFGFVLTQRGLTTRMRRRARRAEPRAEQAA